MRYFAKKTKSFKSEQKTKEKDDIKEQFAEVDTDDIKAEFQESLDQCVELLTIDLKGIKSGRATNDIFDEIEVKAYGEMQMFGDLCQTVVRGQ